MQIDLHFQLQAAVGGFRLSSHCWHAISEKRQVFVPASVTPEPAAMQVTRNAFSDYLKLVRSVLEGAASSFAKLAATALSGGTPAVSAGTVL